MEIAFGGREGRFVPGKRPAESLNRFSEGFSRQPGILPDVRGVLVETAVMLTRAAE
jgi:hypothetical protein